eukprot:NODE_3987_length_721_cov_294.681682.p4 GENE.NODE_3987_length_721_cov_294.681682~~NODE_3987_length_721_cov_294.681682.p4  ORF type:complete len:131 (-),score=28.62 NODE_3987_length_721_cov_294.681682:34-426(-)
MVPMLNAEAPLFAPMVTGLVRHAVKRVVTSPQAITAVTGCSLTFIAHKASPGTLVRLGWQSPPLGFRLVCMLVCQRFADLGMGFMNTSAHAFAVLSLGTGFTLLCSALFRRLQQRRRRQLRDRVDWACGR